MSKPITVTGTLTINQGIARIVPDNAVQGAAGLPLAKILDPNGAVAGNAFFEATNFLVGVCGFKQGQPRHVVLTGMVEDPPANHSVISITICPQTVAF
jgi:hypothetical protein